MSADCRKPRKLWAEKSNKLQVSKANKWQIRNFFTLPFLHRESFVVKRYEKLTESWDLSADNRITCWSTPPKMLKLDGCCCVDGCTTRLFQVLTLRKNKKHEWTPQWTRWQAVTAPAGAKSASISRWWAEWASPVSFDDEHEVTSMDTIKLITATWAAVALKSAAANSILSQRPTPIYTRCFRTLSSPLTPPPPPLFSKDLLLRIFWQVRPLGTPLYFVTPSYLTGFKKYQV